MLVIVRPGFVELNPGIVMMLMAVPLIAGSNLVAKVVSGRDRPEVVVLWQSVVGAVCFTPLGIWFWQTPTTDQLLLFLASGFFGTMGYFFITWAYRLLDISALQPITFLGIVWAALMDVAVWGKTSDVWTFVGAAIIVAATTYIAHREASSGRKTEMTDRLAGKVALITGGASGLGANAATLMAQEGAKVVVADVAAGSRQGGRRQTGLVRPLREARRHVSEDNWQAAIAETVDKFGAIHVLLNSAGIGLSKTVEDITLEEWRRVHAIDLDGVFLGCKHGVAEIKKHTQKLGGSVINISSISGIIAGANMAAYNSAKAGVRLLSKSVALHCAKSGYNIRCNSVHPTFIDTPILDKYRDRFGNEVMQQKLGRQVPIGRLGRPEEVGWALVFLASDESSFMTGSEVIIDGGISAM